MRIEDDEREAMSEVRIDKAGASAITKSCEFLLSRDNHAKTLARLRQVNRQLRKVVDRGRDYYAGDPRLAVLEIELRTTQELLGRAVAKQRASVRRQEPGTPRRGVATPGVATPGVAS
jgi:hypothetical protein